MRNLASSGLGIMLGMAVFATPFLLFSYLDNKQETKVIEACVSNGGEWIDGDEGFGVNMECRRP